MSSHATVQELNRELAARINEEALSDPRSPYVGKFVGIANGQVVVVCDNLDTVGRELQKLEPDPGRSFFLDAGRDYNEVHEIWSAR
jgi:hypothetical protein